MSAVLLAFLCTAHPAPRLVPHAGVPRIVHAGKLYRAEAQLRFTVDTRGIQIPNDDSHDHAQGHIQIARTYVRAAKFTLRVVGNSEAEALQNLKRAIVSSTHDADNELLREQALYDRVTDYGHQQENGPLYGFPGGNDTSNACH